MTHEAGMNQTRDAAMMNHTTVPKFLQNPTDATPWSLLVPQQIQLHDVVNGHQNQHRQSSVLVGRQQTVAFFSALNNSRRKAELSSRGQTRPVRNIVSPSLGKAPSAVIILLSQVPGVCDVGAHCRSAKVWKSNEADKQLQPRNWHILTCPSPKFCKS